RVQLCLVLPTGPVGHFQVGRSKFQHTSTFDSSQEMLTTKSCCQSLALGLLCSCCCDAHFIYLHHCRLLRHFRRTPAKLMNG
ncbi:hypothetical protein ANANG_G00171710, partial [Anguilla anguilla]